MKKLILKLITYGTLISTLIYVLSLYIDLFIFTEDNTVDDAYYLYELIIFIPFPLLFSAVINLVIERNEEQTSRITILVQKIFPTACTILVAGQFMLFSNVPTTIAIVMSISITMILLILGIYLLIKDLRN